ncbi:MAG: hypothetical protein DMH00_00745 [Acidobacteria bacterium]|nr:MAG: hypothetical protein DMH00_00745 [Acidobacteriota bacterium]
MNAASKIASEDFARRQIGRGYSKAAYRVLGRTELRVSAVGFGAYRVDTGTPEHRLALEKALQEGCNLIDTSTNYTDGESERCIGESLAGMAHREEICRDETVVVSKIGYVQGQNLQRAREREAAGEAFPEMVKISDDCWHCLHPVFLADQLTRSLERLKLERLDVCLLHNPEYFLEEAHRQAADPEASRQEFYRRIRVAFTHFEEEVRAGRIEWYGVSSNSLGADLGDPEATSLGRMLEAAKRAAREAGRQEGDHHFAVAQLPMNLFEQDPCTVRKEGPEGRLSTLAFARQQNIGILVNRPLNAFYQGRLIRLADFRMEPPGISLREALDRVTRLEQELDDRIAGHLKTSAGKPMTGFFSWGAQLAGAVGELGGYEQWQVIQDHQITPRLFHAVRSMRSGLPEDLAGTFEGWLERYLPVLGDLLAILRADCAARSQKRSDEIAASLNRGLPPAIRGETLSRKALHLVASVPGVHCVLNGMRHPDYVADSMEILKWEPLAEAEKLLGVQ